MTGQFSPLTRRLIAVGLALLALLLAVQMLIMPLASLLQDSLAEFHASGDRLARLQAIAARPDSPRSEPVPPGLAIAATDAATAGAAFTAAINAARDRAGLKALELALVQPDPAAPRLVSAQVRIVGPSDAVLTFISEMEHQQPLVRFATWKVAAVKDRAGEVEFTGTAQAVWVNVQ